MRKVERRLALCAEVMVQHLGPAAGGGHATPGRGARAISRPRAGARPQTAGGDTNPTLHFPKHTAHIDCAACRKAVLQNSQPRATDDGNKERCSPLSGYSGCQAKSRRLDADSADSSLPKLPKRLLLLWHVAVGTGSWSPGLVYRQNHLMAK